MAKKALTKKRVLFVNEYLQTFNATQAAIAAGYSEKTAYSIGWELLRIPEIIAEIDKHIEAIAVGRNERLTLLSEIARHSDKDSDRISAIEKLGKLAGDYTEKKEINSTVEGVVVYVPSNGRD